jgi:hypothetical protein
MKATKHAQKEFIKYKKVKVAKLNPNGKILPNLVTLARAQLTNIRQESNFWDKHSSLFRPAVRDKEKKFHKILTRVAMVGESSK